MTKRNYYLPIKTNKQIKIKDEEKYILFRPILWYKRFVYPLVENVSKAEKNPDLPKVIFTLSEHHWAISTMSQRND